MLGKEFHQANVKQAPLPWCCHQPQYWRKIWKTKVSEKKCWLCIIIDNNIYHKRDGIADRVLTLHKAAQHHAFLLQTLFWVFSARIQCMICDPSYKNSKKERIETSPKKGKTKQTTAEGKTNKQKQTKQQKGKWTGTLAQVVKYIIYLIVFI